jgi:predicted Ser/Thr protein kinase
VTVVAGRYRLLGRLGQGGMGVVWRAYDELLRRDVAVKELHVRIGVDGDFQSRQVLREARAAARLRHPGVVAVHDVVVDDGRPLIVMELVEGLSLAELIRKDGPLPEQRVAEIGVRVLAALSVAHEQGVVHRDVKPANILLDGNRVVLTDFGIAAMASDTTLTTSVLGSPEYLAPERVNGEPATPATDLWSLGVTLCAALRGESPFQRSDTQATLAAVLTYEPPPIPRAPRLWPVLDAILSKDPEPRPTAAQAAAMLAAVAGIPAASFEAITLPVADPATVRVTRPRRRRQLVALLAVVGLVAAGAVWFLLRSGEDHTGNPATPTLPAPPGFVGFRGDGFTLAVPRGWFKDASGGSDIFWVSDPHDKATVLAHVEWWGDVDPGGAHGVLDGFEKGEFTMDFYSNYQRITLNEKSAPKGMTAAALEATYHVSDDGGIDVHDLMHVVVTDESTYVLTLSAQGGDPATSERLWQENIEELTKIGDSFRVTSR